MENEYTNYAFISYKREDEKWARWLQNKIEAYKLPALIRREIPGLPERIRPVFRDKTDLGGGILEDELKKELHHSQYLIVICSPRSAQSGWVNKEIQTFIREGREEYIIPFIIKGVPGTVSPENECFPPALRALPPGKELLGIDVQEIGKEKAAVRVIAQMLGLRFDTLWQRHMRKKRIVHAGAALVCVSALLIVLGIYDYTRVRYAYYADYVDCYGIAQGIIPLDKEIVKHRAATYRMEYRRVPFGERGFYSWRLYKVALVNSAGVPVPKSNSEYLDRYPVQEYVYTDGYLTEIINRDEFGKKLIRYNLKDDSQHNRAALVDFERKEKHQGSAYLAFSTSSMSNTLTANTVTKSRIKRYAYIRNEKGYITKITYHAHDSEDLQESAICDNDGIFGMEFGLDSLGRRIKVSYLALDGGVIANKYGVARKTYAYDKWGNIAVYEYFDSEGELVNNERKYARAVEEADEYGNIVTGKYYSPSLNLCYEGEIGIAVYKIVYDSRGFKEQTYCYGTDSLLCFNQENWASSIRKYDSNGNVVEITAYGTDGKRCLLNTLYNKVTLRYDSRNRLVKRSVFDCADEPCIDTQSDGHTVTITYDREGNLVEQCVYGTDKKRCFSVQWGFSRQTIEYDSYGNAVKYCYFDEADRPCYNNNLFAIQEIDYDNRGNAVEYRYFDPEGNLCITGSGFAIIKLKLDNYGNCVRESYFDDEKQPVYSTTGFTRKECVYNKKGLITEERYYNEHDSLCLNADWYAVMRRQYDSNGNITSVSFYDADTVPCYIKGYLYSSAVYGYDLLNNKVKEAFFDANGDPVQISSGYSIGRVVYDSQRRPVEYSYYDTAGIPCYREQKYHKWCCTYDERGNLTGNSYYDHAGKPCKLNGSSRTLFTYDEKDLLIRQSEYDEAGNPCTVTIGYSAIANTYDEFGRKVEMVYLGTGDRPVWIHVNANAAAYDECRTKYDYDSRGNMIKIRYFGPDGHLTVRGGCAIVESKYNEKNLLVEKRYYDENYRLMGGPYNVPIEKYNYNKYNDCCVFQLLKSDTSHYVTVRSKYENRKITEMQFTDSCNNPVVISLLRICETPCAAVQFFYDKFGNSVKIQYLNECHELFDTKAGYAYLINHYNRGGRLIQQEVFDKNGNLCIAKTGGWATAINGYDEYGNLTEQSYYDENGNMAKTPWGWARRLTAFDDRGKQLSDMYHCFVNGEWIVNEYRTDARENQVEENVFLPEDKVLIIVLQVETYGQMYESGFQNTYNLLEWNEWNMYDGLENFANAFHRSKGKAKRLVLQSQESGEVVEFTFSEAPLSARLMDYNDKSGKTFQGLSEVYEKWKQEKEEGK